MKPLTFSSLKKLPSKESLKGKIVERLSGENVIYEASLARGNPIILRYSTALPKLLSFPCSQCKRKEREREIGLGLDDQKHRAPSFIYN
jgi:hypothetical protein